MRTGRNGDINGGIRRPCAPASLRYKRAFDELIEADERLTLTEPERIAFRTARREKKIKQTELSVELGGTYYALRDVEGGGEASAEFIEKVRAKGREWGLKEFINEQEQ